MMMAFAAAANIGSVSYMQLNRVFGPIRRLLYMSILVRRQSSERHDCPNTTQKLFQHDRLSWLAAHAFVQCTCILRQKVAMPQQPTTLQLTPSCAVVDWNSYQACS